MTTGERDEQHEEPVARDRPLVLGVTSAEVVAEDLRALGDVDQVASRGVGAWRLPLSWPELQPAGRGPLERGAIDGWKRLCDRMLGHQLSPQLALSHGALPGPLVRARGWLHRDTALRFADYAELCVRALGDRADAFITHVEPRRVAFGALGAPLDLSALASGLAAAHHLLLSHARAAEAARAERSSVKVGITLDLAPAAPYGDDEAHLRATQMCHLFTNRWMLDPLTRGHYPEAAHDAVVAAVGPLSFVAESDLPSLGAPPDFVGVEYRRRLMVETDRRAPLGFRVTESDTGRETTGDGLEITPRALGGLLDALGGNRSLPPLWVSIGAGFTDPLSPNGVIDDRHRIAYLRDHLEVVLAARDRGADIEGLLVRSFCDPPTKIEADIVAAAASGGGGQPSPTQAPEPVTTGLWRRDPATGAAIAKASARYLERVIREGFESADPR